MQLVGHQGEGVGHGGAAGADRLTHGRRRAEGICHGERGKREGMREGRRLRVFWYIKFEKHIEGICNGMFQGVLKL